MKTLIIGCGVIGTIYGWALSQAKQDVTHLVRKNKLTSLQQGIKLDIYDLRQSGDDSVTMELLKAAGRGNNNSGRESIVIPADLKQDHLREQITTYKPKLLTQIPENNNFDLVIIPTKNFQLIDTLKQVYPNLRQAKFLIFCARWDDLTEIDKIIPRAQYLLGYSASSGGYEDDNTMVINIRRDYRIGDYDGTHAKLLQEIIALFATADFTPDIKENMLEWLWVHHAMNGGLIGSLMYAGGFDAFYDANFAKLFHAATLEAIAVLEKRGVNVGAYPDIQPFIMQTHEQVIKCYQQLFLETPIGQRTLRAGHHKHSMEEMRQYYLDVFNTGKTLKVNMPILTSYYDRIKEQ